MDHLDEEIITALESTMHQDEVRRAAYDLIQRQRREIEGLQMRIDALNDTNRILMEREPPTPRKTDALCKSCVYGYDNHCAHRECTGCPNKNGDDCFCTLMRPGDICPRYKLYTEVHHD